MDGGLLVISLIEKDIFKSFKMIRSGVLDSYSACRKNLILFNSSALISGEIWALPKGVISETNSSTVICSSPFNLIISLQNSFSSSRQPKLWNSDSTLVLDDSIKLEINENVLQKSSFVVNRSRRFPRNDLNYSDPFFKWILTW